MYQKEFVEKSIEEVKRLNGLHENEDVVQAWRAGYIFFKEKLEESFRNDYNEDFMEKVENMIDPELDWFE